MMKKILCLMFVSLAMATSASAQTYQDALDARGVASAAATTAAAADTAMKTQKAASEARFALWEEAKNVYLSSSYPTSTEKAGMTAIWTNGVNSYNTGVTQAGVALSTYNGGNDAFVLGDASLAGGGYAGAIALYNAATNLFLTHADSATNRYLTAGDTFYAAGQDFSDYTEEYLTDRMNDAKAISDTWSSTMSDARSTALDHRTDAVGKLADAVFARGNYVAIHGVDSTVNDADIDIGLGDGAFASGDQDIADGDIHKADALAYLAIVDEIDEAMSDPECPKRAVVDMMIAYYATFAPFEDATSEYDQAEGLYIIAEGHYDDALAHF